MQPGGKRSNRSLCGSRRNMIEGLTSPCDFMSLTLTSSKVTFQALPTFSMRAPLSFVGIGRAACPWIATLKFSGSQKPIVISATITGGLIQMVEVERLCEHRRDMADLMLTISDLT
jgi:hypothetical protein